MRTVNTKLKESVGIGNRLSRRFHDQCDRLVSHCYSIENATKENLQDRAKWKEISNFDHTYRDLN